MPQRLFVALWPDTKVRHELTMFQERSEMREADGRPVPAKNIRITLQFLGNVDVLH